METLDLKCERKPPYVKTWERYRMGKTKEFIISHGIRPEEVLFIGHTNEFDRDIAEWLKIKYQNTEYLDLDEPLPRLLHRWDYVFCFDVIEHLMNPLQFLEWLKVFEIPVLLTYPRHPFAPFWSINHFHEFSSRAFYTLITRAGFKIKDRSTFSCKKEWWKLFNGFRPVLRFIFLLFGYPKHEIYILE